ncbi:GIY-YIG nuclease family protein [Arthrobacter rhizosphaerae]|uniref:GIY-YIG nuclease family protein n=1 Tax=Arthrobacter rhizosphaerae TaxID=2855490 RepID=UPI0035574F2A
MILQQHESEFVKIGITYQSMAERMDSLDNTSVPVPPTALWYEYVSDPKAVEQDAHMRLDEHRVRQNREWFRVAPAVAIKAVTAAAVPYRLSSSEVVAKADLTMRLRATFGSLVRKDLQRVSILHIVSGVILESVSRSVWGTPSLLTTSLASQRPTGRQAETSWMVGLPKSIAMYS